MNGNNPYAGVPGEVRAGRRAPADVPELSPDAKRDLRRSVAAIAARTREYLPDEYDVGSDLSAGGDGAQATVAVRPPIGHPVSAGFVPADEPEEAISDDDREEVARGLAATAALQVKQALGDGVTPTAR